MDALQGSTRSGALFHSLPWRSLAILTSSYLNLFPNHLPDVKVSWSVTEQTIRSYFIAKALADDIKDMESMLFSQNNVVWHLETVSECDSIFAVYNKLPKNGEPFRKFAWDILRYSILDVAINIKSTRLGIVVQPRPLPPTQLPNIKFKVSKMEFVMRLILTLLV